MSFSSDRPLLANQLPISLELAENPEKLIQQLELLFKRISNAVNTKEGALYQPQETATFQQYFTTNNPQAFRPVYRTTVDFGSLPNAGAKSVAHGVAFDTNFRMTRFYGVATDPTAISYINLPFSSPTLNQNIKVVVDGTNITVTTAIDYSAYTATTFVLEYTKF